MRLVVSLCLLTGVLAGAAPNVKIIAHRGGVVDAKHPENSLAALNEAVRRGYWMMEMDIQESKDGRIVVHHDDFEQSYGVKRWPREMIWDEISKLRSKEDGSRPLEFHEYAAACKGRTQLMVDIKALKPLRHAVALSEIKEHPELEGMVLVKQGRLSVSPVTKKEFEVMVQLGT